MGRLDPKQKEKMAEKALPRAAVTRFGLSPVAPSGGWPSAAARPPRPAARTFAVSLAVLAELTLEIHGPQLVDPGTKHQTLSYQKQQKKLTYSRTPPPH